MRITAKDVIIGSVVWLIILPLLTPPVAALFLWKLIVTLFANCIRKDLKPMKGSDSMFAPGPSHVYSKASVGLICHLEGIIKVDDLRRLIQEKLLGHEKENSEKPLYERLHSSIETFGGYTFYRRLRNIDINELISEKTCKGNDGDQALEDLLSDWVITNYKKDHPCWEVIVVPRKSMNQTVIALKIHHALADGYSLLYILDQLTGNTSPYLVKNFKDTLCEKILQILAMPVMMIKTFPKSVKNSTLRFPINDRHEWKLLFGSCSLRPLKAIRKRFGVKMNSVIISVVAGALKRYFEDSKDSCPVSLTVTMALPWPNHPTKTSQTRKKLCNHLTSAMVAVPTGNESAVERLMKTNAALNACEDSGVPKAAHRILAPLFGLIPCAMLRTMIEWDRGIDMGFTAIIGGNNYELLGNPVFGVRYFLVIGDVLPTQQISALGFSHTERFDITFAYNPAIFPQNKSPNQILNKHLQDEISELEMGTDRSFQIERQPTTVVHIGDS